MEGKSFPPHKIKTINNKVNSNNRNPWLKWSKTEFDFMTNKTKYYLDKGMAMKEPLNDPIHGKIV